MDSSGEPRPGGIAGEDPAPTTMAFVDYWPDLFSALKAQILAAWPDVEPGGVWESTESARVSISRAIWPIAVTQLLPAREGEWGMHNLVFEQPVVCWRVGQTAGGAQAAERGTLKALVDAIRATDQILAANGSQYLVTEFSNFDMFEGNEGMVPWFVRNTGFQSANVALTVLVGDRA